MIRKGYNAMLMLSIQANGMLHEHRCSRQCRVMADLRPRRKGLGAERAKIILLSNLVQKYILSRCIWFSLPPVIIWAERLLSVEIQTILRLDAKQVYNHKSSFK